MGAPALHLARGKDGRVTDNLVLLEEVEEVEELNFKRETEHEQ